MQPSPPRSERLAFAYSSGGGGVATRPSALSEARSGRRADDGASGGRRGGLVGRLAGLAVKGAAVAAVAVLAHKSAPTVLHKSQEAGQWLAEEQAKLSARWLAHQQRRREERRAREAAQRAPPRPKPQQRQQQGGRPQADVPPPHLAGRRMADLPLPPKAAQPSVPAAAPWQEAQAAAAAKAAAAAQQQRHKQQQPKPQPKPQQSPPQRRPAGAPSDPLPPHLAAAARHAAAGRVPPVAQMHPPPHGQLFPAMPPPDVAASMG